MSTDFGNKNSQLSSNRRSEAQLSLEPTIGSYKCAILHPLNHLINGGSFFSIRLTSFLMGHIRFDGTHHIVEKPNWVDRNSLRNVCVHKLLRVLLLQWCQSFIRIWREMPIDTIFRFLFPLIDNNPTTHGKVRCVFALGLDECSYSGWQWTCRILVTNEWVRPSSFLHSEY